MFKIRTNKKIECGGVHESDLKKVEFRYQFRVLGKDAMEVQVDGYKIIPQSDGNEDLELIIGSSFYNTIEGKELIQLMDEAELITKPINGESALDYLGRLVGNGIKLYIASRKLWRGQLEVTDFE